MYIFKVLEYAPQRMNRVKLSWHLLIFLEHTHKKRLGNNVRLAGNWLRFLSRLLERNFSHIFTILLAIKIYFNRLKMMGQSKLHHTLYMYIPCEHVKKRKESIASHPDRELMEGYSFYYPFGQREVHWLAHNVLSVLPKFWDWQM